jgi:2-succinyl-5-enolpyruvyl-6-hydroxy-3-cyclohexene-1-carboxylate synthase
LIVAGPEATHDRKSAKRLIDLARAAAIPLLADVSSGIRFCAGEGDPVCGHADLFLRGEGFADRDGPDLVIRFGRVPVSKTIQEYIAGRRPFLVAIQPDIGRRDPDAIASWIIEAGVEEICDRLLARIDDAPRNSTRTGWRDLFLAAERATGRFLARESLPLEAAATRGAVAAIPQDALLFLSNSMPVRWAEAYCPVSTSGTPVYVSRGVSGIDGITSTALGTSAGTGRPLLLVAGDVAFLHDLGGLFATRYLDQPAVILLLNNDGGGIFSFLPIGEFPDLCVPLFRVPHGCRLEAAATLFGGEHHVANDAEQASRLVAEGFRGRGLRIVEVRTESERMVREHRDLLARLTGVIRNAIPKGSD